MLDLRNRGGGGADRGDGRLVGRLQTRLSPPFELGRIAMPTPGYLAYRISSPPRSRRWRLNAGRRRCRRRRCSSGRMRKPLDGVLIARRPANPTGTMYSSPRRSTRWSRRLRRWGLLVHLRRDLPRPVHNGRQATALAPPDRAIVVSPFSKYYCTGWRIGWTVMLEVLVADRPAGAEPDALQQRDLAARRACRLRSRLHRRAFRRGQGRLYRQPRLPARASAASRLRRSVAGRRRLLRPCVGGAFSPTTLTS